MHRTLSGVQYTYFKGRTAHTYHVKAGYLTDFSSVPKIGRVILDKDGVRNKVASVAHDELYESGSLPRKLADQIYRDLLVACGTSRWKAWVAYRSLRAGGWVAYNRYRKLEKEAVVVTDEAHK